MCCLALLTCLKFPLCVYVTSRGTGTVYAVNEKYRGDGSAWARGIVHELPGRGRVRVLLPDTGLLLIVHWTALRQIDPKFTTLCALVSASDTFICKS